MKKIKIFSFTLALLLAVFAFSSCSKFEYDNSTIVAQVTAIDGQKVTLLVGEMDMGGNMMQGGMMPGGNMQGGNMTPPTGDSTFPAIPDGEMPEMPEGETMPEMPEGGMPQMPNDGSMPEMPNGEMPEGFGSGMQSPFTAGEDSITLTLNEETVKTLSVGSIVQITFGDNGSVESLTVLGGNMQGGFGGGNMIPPTNIPEGETGDSDDTNS